MIAEIIGIIASGVTAVEGVTQIFKNVQDISDSNSRTRLQQSLDSIQARVESVENELSKQHPDSNRLIESYTALINALCQDSNYSARLKIIQTEYGTWKILRREEYRYSRSAR